MKAGVYLDGYFDVVKKRKNVKIKQQALEPQKGQKSGTLGGQKGGKNRRKMGKMMCLHKVFIKNEIKNSQMKKNTKFFEFKGSESVGAQWLKISGVEMNVVLKWN